MKGCLIQLEKTFIAERTPVFCNFKAGDTISVVTRLIAEDGKERLQTFTGLCIARRNNNGWRATFVVRKKTENVGVERTFALWSQVISKIVLVSRGVVRRSKIYYIRHVIGKKAKIVAALDQS